MKQPSVTVTTLIVLSVILAGGALFWANYAAAGDTYVRGRYGIRCYILGQENRAIKPENLMKYPTLEACVQSFND